MADKKEKLFSDFSPVSTEQWMEKVTADLKGADFEKKLVWKTNEGFKVKPFYRMEDLEGLKTTDALPGEFPYLRGTKKSNNEWLVRQEIKVECPKEANAKALDILNKGVDSLSFHVKAKELNAEYIETLLNGIQAECVELNFSTCQGHVVELAGLLVAYFQKKDYDVKKLRGSVNYDFFNKMLTRGKEKGDMVQTAKALIVRNSRVQIVFESTSTEFAAEAFDIEALHYLVKPVKKEKLFGILDRFFDSVYSLRTVNVKVGRLEESIYLSDILYVEADGKRAKVHTKKGVMEVSMSVAELERVLPEKEFCRPIRWALVSMREIAAMPTDVLKLSDQTEIPISRLKRREIQETFADYSWRSTRRRMRGKTG